MSSSATGDRSEFGSCQLLTYRRLKTIENFKTAALKEVAVANQRWSLTKGFDFYSDLTGKCFYWLFGKLVTYGRNGPPSVIYTVINQAPGLYWVNIARIGLDLLKSTNRAQRSL